MQLLGDFPQTVRQSHFMRSVTCGIWQNLAGAGGFEPPNGGIKIRCLTTWLRPSRREGPFGRARETGRNIPASTGGRNRRPRAESRPKGAESFGIALAGRGFGGYNAAFEPARSVAQSGSAPRSGRGGRRFESCHSDQVRKRKKAPGASWRGSLPLFRLISVPQLRSIGQTATK